MSKGKTGLLVLTAFAAMFFLFVAILYWSSTKREAALDRKSDLNDRLDLIAETDLTIYWLGEPYKELDQLSSVVSVIPTKKLPGPLFLSKVRLCIPRNTMKKAC